MKISTLSGFTKTSYIPCLVKIRYKEGWGGGGNFAHDRKGRAARRKF